ncbi:MAG: GxxExxY protein [Mucilaginibacter polytrichastri]|nr:GxxExxY protein [Mucilaginibacter polytrichastri]
MEPKNAYQHDPLTAKIIGCCFEVHSAIGPGFPEKIYNRALQIALAEKYLNFVAEKCFSVTYQRQEVGVFRCDICVNDVVIVELKSVTGYMPKLFTNQLLSYLKASRIKTGLLVNFGNTSCEVKRLSV